ncbi:MAG: ATP-binding protein [Pseudomonadota bacterium]
MKKIFKKIRRSLTLRMMLLFLIAAFAISFILHLTLGIALKNQFETKLMPHILQYQHYILKEIGTPPSISRAATIAERLPVDISIYGPRINWSSTGALLDPREIVFKQHRKRHFQHGEWKGRTFLRSPSGAHTVYLGFQRGPGQRLGRPVFMFAILAVLGVLFLSYLGMRRLFRPVGTIQQGVQRIGGGELQHRIAVDKKDELGDLANSINTMADDIEGMLNAKRELLLAISHELRSPLTRSRVSAELLDDPAARERINKDLDEMEQLIGELLESERLNSRHASLSLAPVNPNITVTDVIRDNFPNQGIITSLQDDITPVMLDESRLRLLIRNLLSNAIRHNRTDHGQVEIVTLADNNGLDIRIRDHGEGIAEKHLPYLTEPFYRVDPSRQRKTGGYGLGLHLCRMITEAHGGSLIISSEQNVGTTVTVRLPVTLAIQAEKSVR